MPRSPAAAAPLAGLFIDRVGLNLGMCVAVAAWSVAGLWTGLVESFRGLAMVRGTYESEITNFSYIPLELAFMSGPASYASLLASIGSRTQPVPLVTGSQTLQRIDNAVGGVLGFEAAIDMTGRLAIVPGVRAIIFSNEGQSVFLTRPEVGVRWSF